MNADIVLPSNVLEAAAHKINFSSRLNFGGFRSCIVLFLAGTLDSAMAVGKNKRISKGKKGGKKKASGEEHGGGFASLVHQRRKGTQWMYLEQ